MSIKTIWRKLLIKLRLKTAAPVQPNEYFDMKGNPISLPTQESYIYHNPNTDMWYYAEVSYLDMDRACIYHIYRHPITLEMRNGMMKIKKTDIHQLTEYPFIDLDKIKSDQDKND